MTNGDMVNEIIKSARAYQDKLVGKTFMYVFNAQYIEVTYKTSNFCHLTGVGTNLSAEDFFVKAKKGTLLPTEINNKNHSYNDVKRKLKHLVDMANMVTSECFMLEDVNTNTFLFKYAATNLKFTICFDKNANSTNTNNLYFPRSLRRGDSFDKSRSANVVTHIFCKRSDKKKYDTFLFAEKGETLCGLPQSVKGKLSAHLAKGEKLINSYQYLFDESEKILKHNPDLEAEFQILKTKYLSLNGLTPVPQIQDGMNIDVKFNTAEQYYAELCGVILSDKNFAAKYKTARDNYRDAQNQVKQTVCQHKPPKRKHHS